MSREAARRRLERLEARRFSRRLQSCVITYDPAATEAEVDALVEKHLHGLPSRPSVRVVLVPEQFETIEEWEAAGGEE